MKKISDNKKVSFQFPFENGNVGGFPAFKRDGVPQFRCCMLKRKEKNDRCLPCNSNTYYE